MWFLILFNTLIKVLLLYTNISVISYKFKYNSNKISCNQRIKFKTSFQSKPENQLGGDIITKSIFSLTETFGWLTNNLSRSYKSDGIIEFNHNKIKKVDLKTISNRILNEYNSIFWATGKMDISLWTDNCTFADPFSSFGGKGSTLRFKSNADNLGKLVIDPIINVTSFETDTINYTVTIGWNFRSKLSLPWKPILAAAGFTTHYIDKNTGLIYRYEERWKSKPWDVIQRLFKPSRSSSSINNNDL